MSHSPKALGGNCPTGEVNANPSDIGRQFSHFVEDLVHCLVAHVSRAHQSLWFVAKAIASRRAGAAGVFPLRLGRQPVSESFLPRQPIAKGQCVVPAHVDDRVVVGLLEAGEAPRELRLLGKLSRVFARPAGAAEPVLLGVGSIRRRRDELGELAARDFIHADRQRLADAHHMLRCFAGEPRELVLGAGRHLVGPREQVAQDSPAPIRNSPAGMTTSFMPIEFVSATSRRQSSSVCMRGAAIASSSSSLGNSPQRSTSECHFRATIASAAIKTSAINPPTITARRGGTRSVGARDTRAPRRRAKDQARFLQPKPREIRSQARTAAESKRGPLDLIPARKQI